jgi:hypothetical protein
LPALTSFYIFSRGLCLFFHGYILLTVALPDGSFPSFGDDFALQHAASSKFLSSHGGVVHQNYTFGYQEVHAANTSSEDAKWQVAIFDLCAR